MRKFLGNEIDFKELKICMWPQKTEKQVTSHFHKMRYRYTRIIGRKGKDFKFLSEMIKFFEKEKKVEKINFEDSFLKKSLKVDDFLLEALIRAQPIHSQKCQNLTISLDEPTLRLASQVAYINRQLASVMERERDKEWTDSASTPSDPFEELGREGGSVQSEKDVMEMEGRQVNFNNFSMSTMAFTNIRQAFPQDDPDSERKIRLIEPFNIALPKKKIECDMNESHLEHETFTRNLFQRDFPPLFSDFSRNFEN